MNGHFRIQSPDNVMPCDMAPGMEERDLLKAELERQSSAEPIVIPAIINGKEVYTDTRFKVTAPHDHSLVLAEYCQVDEELLKEAVEASMTAKEEWEALPKEHRFAIFEKAALLIEGKYRYLITAATMLGQSKTPWEGDADSPGELCDLIRYSMFSLDELYGRQPKMLRGVFNRQEYRPLEGFICAISPFNFTALGGYLPASPAIAGNVVVWKPASTSVLSNYYVMKAFMEAGLPAGVINFVPSRGSDISKVVIADPRLAGVHFTGSTKTFKDIWKQTGENIHNYRSYPRLVGETGGKDYIFATESSNQDALVASLIRGAYEYSGQKCSATSRAYIPAKIWAEIREKLLSEIKTVKAGDIKDFTNFLGAVIDESSFNKIAKYIEDAKSSPDAELLCGGYDGSKGWFIDPTLIQVKTPDYITMKEELFGPVLSVYVYEENEYDAMVDHCANSSEYALTGAIHCQDRAEIASLVNKLRNSAGVFYINDKSSGALTGHLPFAGGRGSGTNDKTGSLTNMSRWVSLQSIKDNLTPVEDYRFPYMKEY